MTELPTLPPIVSLRDASDALACARIMASSEPWITLGRDEAAALRVVEQAGQEAWVALDDARAVAGFVLLSLQGALSGYIRTIAVREDQRSRGLGRALIEFSARRIHRVSPNVFLIVSAFNPRARALYERLGFVAVGELPDYIVRGRSEWLMRRTIGPIAGYTPPEGQER